MELLSIEKYQEHKTELLRQYRQLLKSLGEERLSKEKIDLVRSAFVVAADAHEGVMRKSGEPYIFHPLAVAQIVASELNLGATSVACALMHDVVEDTEYTIEDIEQKFGPKIAAIIDGLTKIANVFDTVEKDQSLQAENFKKMLLTLGEDLRVILIKLCDRLHNMRTLSSVSQKTKLKIASETLYIYAPLAHRLGLYAIKSELEDLSLKFMEPDLYKEIQEVLTESKDERDKFITEFIQPLREELIKAGVEITEIKGRSKSIYGIANKMKKQQIGMDQVYDLFAIRVIVNSPVFLEKADCWKVYSIITDKYRTHANRLRDWLSQPKSNGYEALHTTVLGPEGKWIEVQIRSKRMDDIAERGLAAHWRYKADGTVDATPQDQTYENWLALVKETLENRDLSALDLVNEFKFSLLQEEIYLFTPKGEVKNLPSGSTALDFAFAIHTEVGHKTIGAKVNNKLVPINHVLKNGDIVEILTTAKSRAHADWLDLVKTGRAKSKIREFLRAEKTQLSQDGKEIAERKFKSQDVPMNEKNVQKIIKHFGYNTPNEFYHALAAGEIKNEKLKFKEIILKKTPSPVAKAPEEKPIAKKAGKKVAAAIIIGEDYEMEYSLANCCNPVPGDPIFGFVTVSDGIKIHRTDCPNATRLMSHYGYRIIPCQWRTTGYDKAFSVKLQVTGIDDVGIVSKIADIVSKDMQVNMKSINIQANDAGTFVGQLEILVNNVSHLSELMKTIQSAHKFIEVKRLDDDD